MNMNRMLSLLVLTLGVSLSAVAQNGLAVELLTLEGGKTAPASWVDGKTPYVVSFWFVACKFCLEEMDAISESFEDWQGEKPFRFYAVCTDDSRALARAKALVKSRGWDGFRFVFDVNREFTRAMNVTACPCVFLYDKDGRLVYSHQGYTPGDEEILFEKIKSL